MTPDVAATQPLRSDRSLRADPEYQPAFRPAPSQVLVEVDLTPEDRELVDTLLTTGIYGETPGEAVPGGRHAVVQRECLADPSREFTDAEG